jgi:hypothetical protein
MDRLPAEHVPSITRPLTLKDDADCDQKAAFLTAQVAGQIEEALCKVGDFGEVRLVVVKGRLRFIQIMRSENVQEP